VDIDIDLPPTADLGILFPYSTIASMVKDNKLQKHPCGRYFQRIPIDPITKWAAIPYDQAQHTKYIKIDMLHLHLLSLIPTKTKLRQLMHTPPNWGLLCNEEFVQRLLHVGNQFKVVNEVKPTSVIELADCLALVRPTKRQHLSAYLNNKELTRPLLYRSEGDQKSSFNKGHAIAYALTIVAQMNLLTEDSSA
jgi:hypothetical protein